MSPMADQRRLAALDKLVCLSQQISVLSQAQQPFHFSTTDLRLLLVAEVYGSQCIFPWALALGAAFFLPSYLVPGRLVMELQLPGAVLRQTQNCGMRGTFNRNDLALEATSAP